ncbi:substrate-binding periplasmic protein [Massilia antarctica]|uniref:substrate-binding periplasmic protein n=1 Tax=Massilia antarctica TaxID=2765360 RepID=UPI003F88702C
MMTPCRLPARLLALQLCCVLSLGAVAGTGGGVRAAASPPEMLLASTDWLPYTGARLPLDGAASAVVATAARRFGYTVRFAYFPWLRTVQLGHEDSRFAGYFPAYYTEQRARDCHLSAPISTSIVGLAHLKSTPLHWHSVGDLAGMKIGVVAGYANGAPFDAMVKQGKIRADLSRGDLLNLKKLLAARVPAIVIDKAVLRYLLFSSPEFAGQREQVVFHDHILGEMAVHICFQPTKEGLSLQQSFNAALRGMDLGKFEAAYFRELEAAEKSGAK